MGMEVPHQQRTRERSNRPGAFLRAMYEHWSAERLRTFSRFLLKLLPWFLAAAVLLAVAAYCGLVFRHNRFLLSAGRHLPLTHLLTEYIRLRFALDMATIASAYVSLLVLGAWPFFGFAAYLLISATVTSVFYAATGETHTYAAMNEHYFAYFRRKTRCSSLIFHASVLGIVGGVFLKAFPFGDTDLREVARFFSICIAAVVPLVYTFTWSHYYATLRARRNRPDRSAQRLEYYLISLSAIRRRLRNVIFALLFLALLGWVLVPALFSGMEMAASRSD